MNLALFFTPAPDDFVQGSLAVIFGFMPRIAAASLLAYLVSQMHDVWAYDVWRKRFPGRRFIWLRNNASTMISQFIDSTVFTVLAFWGVFPVSVLVQIFWTTYLLKWIVGLADTPFIYLARQWYDKGKIARD